jgi:myotubularin-related protein 1/2
MAALPCYRYYVISEYFLTAVRWDRTPQVCSLAQLLLDKFYRTTRGYCILIEKEWLRIGHKFGERLGLNLEDTFKEVERSPIFLQFLDATWQVMQQFPWAFEFTEDLLLVICEHIYSGRFGTFLLNSEKEREDNKLNVHSPSLWTYIISNAPSYLNPFYQPNKEPSVLYPSTDIKTLQLWTNYYLRYLCPDKLPEYNNKFVQLGKEMKSTIVAMEEDMQVLQKDNERLIQTLKLMKEELIKYQQQPGTAHKARNGFGNSRLHGTGSADALYLTSLDVAPTSNDMIG